MPVKLSVVNAEPPLKVEVPRVYYCGASVCEDASGVGCLENFQQFSLDEVKLAFHLVKRARVFLWRVVGVRTDFFQLLEGLPWVHLWLLRGGGRHGVRRVVIGVVGHCVTIARAVGGALTKQITHAALVVVSRRDAVRRLIASRLARFDGAGPVLGPVAWLVTSASVGEVAGLVAAAKVTFRGHAEEVEPLKVVLPAAGSLGVLRQLSALYAAVNNVDRRAEGSCDVETQVGGVGFKEASHDIVHARLRVLRCHVEPDACSHG